MRLGLSMLCALVCALVCAWSRATLRMTKANIETVWPLQRQVSSPRNSNAIDGVDEGGAARHRSQQLAGASLPLTTELPITKSAHLTSSHRRPDPGGRFQPTILVTKFTEGKLSWQKATHLATLCEVCNLMFRRQPTLLFSQNLSSLDSQAI